ncbi:DNA topoisomerase 2-binding protein 1, partial [Coemansia sp. RSA 2681]
IDAHRRVVQLGGSVSSNLTTSVTHVVTKDTSLFCRKYHVSAKVGIPVVSLDFISECELEARERSSGTPDSDTSEAVRQITERNRFPPFAGCRISSTGFSADMRKEIERLVENSELASATSLLAGRMADSLVSCPIRSSELIGGGGLYCGVLTSDCTHLIALNPEGEKFKFAKARSIPIVSLEWLVQCLIARARQKEDEYLVAGGPTPSGTATMAPSVTNLRRLQSLGRAQPGLGQTDGPATGSHGYRVHASAPGSDRTLSTTLVHPGIPSTRESVASSGALRQEGQMASITRNCTRAASSGLDFVDSFDLAPGLVESPRMDTEDDSDVVVVINQPDAPAPGLRPPQPPLPRGARMVFKSCRIALSQASLSLARRNEWRSKVVAAGGDCVSEDSTISAPQHVNPWTHFVVDDSDELCAEDIRVLQLVHAATATDRPLVVQCGWLRECWRSGRRAKESAFSIPWPELSAESSVSALARRVPKRQLCLQPMVERPLTSSAMDDSEFGLLTTDSRHNAKKRGIEHLGDMNPKHPRRLVGGLDTPVITIASGGKADDVSLAVFARCVFTSLGLTASATAKFKQVVQENGGVYTDVFGGYSNATPEQPRAQAPILPLDRALNTLAGHIDDTSVTDAYIVIPLHGVNELDMCVAAQKRYKSMRIVTECWVDQC